MLHLHFLNIFFFVFHTVWMLFNCVGWTWRRTRPLHLTTILLTAFSWFALGIRYGWGYCLCTDWHWQVREALGIRDDSHSYTHLLIHVLTGLDPSPLVTDILTGGVFAVTALLSIALNLRDRRLRRADAAGHQRRPIEADAEIRMPRRRGV